MIHLECLVCKEPIRSFLVDRERSTAEAVRKLADHMTKNHEHLTQELGQRIKLAVSLVPAILFANEFIYMPDDSPNKEWLEQELDNQYVKFLDIIGISPESEDATQPSPPSPEDLPKIA